uniref:Major facilitator superfamily (MFS) profile domain-containing protein n=1 Tax=Tetranychus urticae TaxID=32264 RepID=T1KKN5_TETUR
MLVGSIMGTIGLIFRVTRNLIHSQQIVSMNTLIFRALVWAPYGTPFAVLCGLVRIFGSIEMAALYSCVFAAVPTFFADHISQMFGLLEMCFSVGTIIGPLAGGFLHEVGYHSVTLVVICQMFIGIGFGIGYVARFTQAMREKDLTSFADDPDASGLICSLFVSVLSLG